MNIKVEQSTRSAEKYEYVVRTLASGCAPPGAHGGTPGWNAKELWNFEMSSSHSLLSQY
jgi:hypothetical protein